VFCLQLYFEHQPQQKKLWLISWKITGRHENSILTTTIGSPQLIIPSSHNI
jgi:hypothetical protein